MCNLLVTNSFSNKNCLMKYYIFSCFHEKNINSFNISQSKLVVNVFQYNSTYISETCEGLVLCILYNSMQRLVINLLKCVKKKVAK